MSTDKMMEEEITKEKPPVREQELRIRQMTFRISEFLYEETKKEADNITEFHKKEKRLFVMKQEKIQNELLKLVLALRQLDDRGIMAISNAIQVQLRENEKRVGKCKLSLIK